MENKKGSGASARAMEGKGFYIVLFLCAAVIAASAWIIFTDAGTDVEVFEATENTVDISDAVVTMLPAGTPRETAAADAVETIARDEAEEMSAPEEPSEDTDVWDDSDAWEDEEDWEEEVYADSYAGYVWPVWGSVEVPYAVETLLYDATMADWRTHDGIDVACALGDEVVAAASGTVTDVYEDALYGTTVVIENDDGIRSVYANLASEPTVSEDDWVTTGQVIGSVGRTALGETNEVPHLHFAMSRDGVSLDPLEYLPTDAS